MARVLIIDDEPPLREVLGMVVGSFGHEVSFAGDGLEGVKVFREAPTDVVMVDMMMPHSGLSTIRVLREQFPQVKIIAMTGGGAHRLDYARDLGAQRTLMKPFHAEEVAKVLNEVLSGKEG